MRCGAVRYGAGGWAVEVEAVGGGGGGGGGGAGNAGGQWSRLCGGGLAVSTVSSGGQARAEATKQSRPEQTRGCRTEQTRADQSRA